MLRLDHGSRCGSVLSPSECLFDGVCGRPRTQPTVEKRIHRARERKERALAENEAAHRLVARALETALRREHAGVAADLSDPHVRACEATNLFDQRPGKPRRAAHHPSRVPDRSSPIRDGFDPEQCRSSPSAAK
jgi:hypothetical protein